MIWSRIFGVLRAREQHGEHRRAFYEAMNVNLLDAAESTLQLWLRSERVDPEALAALQKLAYAHGDYAVSAGVDKFLQNLAAPVTAIQFAMTLIERGLPHAARSVLGHALSLDPFDAQLRSETAYAHARAAEPHRVREVLALHPCLGDDPSALFQFGWSSLLVWDVDAARSVLQELLPKNAALGEILASALARAGQIDEPKSAADFLFLTHGTIVANAANWADLLACATQAYPQTPRRIVFAEANESLATWAKDHYECVNANPAGLTPAGFLCGKADGVQIGGETVVCALRVDLSTSVLLPHVLGTLSLAHEQPSALQPRALQPSSSQGMALRVPSKRRPLYFDAPVAWPAQRIRWRVPALLVARKT